MKFVIDKDKLTLQDADELNSGSIQYYEVDVKTDSSWNDLTIEAVLTPTEGDAIIYDQTIAIAVINGKMFIDKEISGSYVIGFKGYVIENEMKPYQISTNLQGIYFDTGAGQLIPTNKNIPKPSEWEIYVAQIEAIANQAGESAQTATEQAGIATAQAEEATRQAGIAITQAGIATTQAEESARQAGIAKDEADRAERARIGFEEEVQEATQNFNTNATNKTNAYNENASNKTTAYNNNASDKLEAYNSNATSKTNAFNENASSKQGSFDTNATNKTNDFNTNASDKTTAFNNNATQKTTDFNNNATEKTGDYNSNATAKTTAFNENAQAKTDEFNQQAESYNLRITDLEEETESLRHDLNKATLDSTDTPSDNITLNNTIQAQLKKFVLEGKTEQFTTTGKQLFNKSNIEGKNCTISYSNGIYTATKTSSSPSIKSLINLPAGDYTLNISSALGTVILYSDNTTVSNLGDINSIKNFTISENVSSIRFWFSEDTKTFDFDNLFILSGTYTAQTMPDYEPYTGGIPSPSPIFPQEIINVEGINIFNLKKFLTDRNVSYTENTDGSLTFTPVQALYSNPLQFSNKDIAVSLSGLITNVTSSGVRIFLVNQSNENVGQITSATTKVENINASKIRIDWSTDGTVTMKNIMLNKGATAQPYVPYNSIQIKKCNKNKLVVSTCVGGDLDSSGRYSSSGITGFSISGETITFTPTVAYKGFVSDYIEVKPNTNHTTSFETSGASLSKFYCFYDSNKTHIERNQTGLSPANAKYMKISNVVGSGGVNVQITVTNIQVEERK